MKTYFLIIENPDNFQQGNKIIQPKTFETVNNLYMHYITRGWAKDTSFLAFKIKIQDNESLKDFAKLDKGNTFYNLMDFAEGKTFQLDLNTLMELPKNEKSDDPLVQEIITQKKAPLLEKPKISLFKDDPYQSKLAAMNFLKQMPTDENAYKNYVKIANHWRKDEEVFKCILPEYLLKAGKNNAEAAQLIMASRLAVLLKPSEIVSIYKEHRHDMLFRNSVSDITKLHQNAMLFMLGVKDKTVFEVIEKSANLLLIFKLQYEQFEKLHSCKQQKKLPPTLENAVNELQKNGIDPFEFLNVSVNAGKNTIQKQYRKEAFKLHPDRNLENPKEAEENFMLLGLVKDVLLNTQAKQEFVKK